MPLCARIDTRTVTPQPWRNGGGQTRELYAWPDGQHWRLRISLATIERAGPFSVFQNTQRTIAVIEGAGVLLKINDGIHRLSAESEPLVFDGSAPAHCTPLEGPTTDLNLMTTAGQGEMRRAASGTPWISSAPQRGVFARVAGTLTPGSGGQEKVPAGTLLWFADAAGAAFNFQAENGDRSTPAWWLGYDPAGPVRHKGGR